MSNVQSSANVTEADLDAIIIERLTVQGQIEGGSYTRERAAHLSVLLTREADAHESLGRVGLNGGTNVFALRQSAAIWAASANR